MTKAFWSNLLNKLPDTLQKVGALAVTVDQMTNSSQSCVWGNRNGPSSFNPGSYYDSNSIIQAGIARMEQFSQSVVNGGGSASISSRSGGSTTAGGGVTDDVDQTLGRDIYKGKDTQFIKSTDWESLNQKKAGGTLSADETTSWTNIYKTGLTNLAQSFGLKLSPNGEGAVGLDEFTKFFKKAMKTKYSQMTDAQLEQAARKAWDNINVTKSGTDELDVAELKAFMATVDAGGTLDGKISQTELVDILDKLANDDTQTISDLQSNHTTFG